MIDDPVTDSTPFLASWRAGDRGRSLWMSGELDLDAVPVLVSALDGEVRPGTDVVFDVQELTFLDASGVRVLMVVRQALGPGGRVVVRHPGRTVQRVLELAGIDGVEIEHEEAPPLSATGSSSIR